MAKYKIQPNDTLTTIAAQYGVDVGALQQANNIQNPNLIYAGATLDIPNFVDTSGSPKIDNNALVPSAKPPTKVQEPVTNPSLPSNGGANPIPTPNPPSSSAPTTATSSTTSSSQVAVPPEYATLGITPQQYAQLASPQGMDPLAYSSLIDNINTRLSTNNELTTQKNLILQQMYGEKLTPDMLAKLPPDQQQLVNRGNKAEMEFQVRVLNDQISGRANTLSSSINYLTQGYEKAQSQYNTEVANVLNYAKALNAKPSEIMKALYPGDAARLGESLDKLAAPLLTTTQVAPFVGSTVQIPEGTIAAQTNNPLNIKYSPTSAAGGNDSGIAGKDGGTFAAFNTPEEGLQAAVNLLKSSTYSNLTVDQAMKQWSNNGYGAEVSPQINSSQTVGSLSDNQINQLVSDMAQRESGATITASNKPVDALPPPSATANIPDPYTGLTPNGIYQAALDWAFAGKMIPTGIGNSPKPMSIRAAVVNKASAIATASGTSFPAMQALYKSNASAAKQNVERLARVESVMNATQMNFPRLGQLADSVKAQGLNITESDIQSGQAAVLSKFGSPEAASYVELINTIRSDYSAAQAALAGSRGGQFFASNAQEAIPIGLTSQQYEAIKNTLVYSSQNASTAINDEVQNLLGTSGSISQNNTGGTYDDYLKAIK